MKIILWLSHKFKKNKESNELNKLKEKIDILQAISVLTHRKKIQMLFNISCVLIFTTLVCIISFLLLGVTVICKILSIFSFIVLIPILTLLYIILNGKNTVVICSNCRRIKCGGEYYVLEEFINNLSHDLCLDCANVYNSVGMQLKNKKLKKRIYYG